MEIIAIIGSLSLGACLAGTIVLLIMGSDSPKLIRIFTLVSMIPLVICFSILATVVKETSECKVKYKKVNVDLYEKVK